MNDTLCGSPSHPRGHAGSIINNKDVKNNCTIWAFRRTIFTSGDNMLSINAMFTLHNQPLSMVVLKLMNLTWLLWVIRVMVSHRTHMTHYDSYDSVWLIWLTVTHLYLIGHSFFEAWMPLVFIRTFPSSFFLFFASFDSEGVGYKIK